MRLRCRAVLLTVVLLSGCQLEDYAEESSASVASGSSESNPAVDAAGFTSPTPTTREHQASVREALPLEQARDVEQARRGLIARIPELVVLNQEGQRVWDLSAYHFLEGDAPESVNPSLWRQARLNNEHGLYQLTDRIYQVRGFDLTNMTLIRGDRGWIIIDPLTTVETAQAALDFVKQQLGDRPVTGILFTHSQIDHFGGAMGIASPEQAEKGQPSFCCRYI